MNPNAMLLGVALANLLIDVGLFSSILQIKPTSSWFVQAFFAIPFSQALLLGYWLALGDGKWYWRLGISIPLAMACGYSIAVAMLLSDARRNHDDMAQSHMLAFIYIALLLTVFVLILPVRRFRGWRLTRDNQTAYPITRQFQIGDLLLWMIPMGGVLGTLRFLLSLDSTVGQGLLQFSVTLSGFAVSTWLAMMAAFRRTEQRKSIYVCGAVVALMATAFAIREWLRVVQLVGTGLPWTTATMILHAFGEMLAIALPAVVVFLNCLVLRGLGFRLVRPGDAGGIASGTRSLGEA